jgi:hypothetical protein
MIRRAPIVALFAFALLASSCGDDAITAEPDGVNFVSHDIYKPPPQDMQDMPDIVAPEDLQAVDEAEPPPDLPPVETGCGDGVCSGAENAQNCAKDCQVNPAKVAFVFAHKGDEIGALGRIYDLTKAGSTVFVFYLTFDETPIETFYGSPSKLAVAALGVPAENIYLYEQHIEWGMVSGTREVLDRLSQHLTTVQPEAIYLPQLCGGELEDELAHVIGLQAAKRASLFPDYFEVPSPSNYYEGTPPPLETAQQDPDGFVNHFIRRWKLIPKNGDELKPTLGSQDMLELRLAAAHIMDDWFQGFLYKIPEDRLLYLLRETQRYRAMPPGQKVDKKPFLESLENLGATYIYEDQGFSFDEFKHRARVIESFYGSDVRTNPPALPYFNEPIPLKIIQDFDVVLDIRSFSPDPDTFSFMVGYGPAKQPTEHCQPVDPVQVSQFESLQITVKCEAKNPIGEHTYYFRIYSQMADEWDDSAKFTEVPFHISIGTF